MGNICAPLDEEIFLEPREGSSTIEIPIRMNELQRRTDSLCKCVFDIATDDMSMVRIRVNKTEISQQLLETDFLQFETCDEGGRCACIDLLTEDIVNSVDHFSIKVKQNTFEYANTLKVHGM